MEQGFMCYLPLPPPTQVRRNMFLVANMSLIALYLLSREATLGIQPLQELHRLDVKPRLRGAAPWIKHELTPGCLTSGTHSRSLGRWMSQAPQQLTATTPGSSAYRTLWKFKAPSTELITVCAQFLFLQSPSAIWIQVSRGIR